MRKSIILFLAALCAALTTTAAAVQHQQQVLSEKMIRLHVVANSDSRGDQNLKLKVRDAVLAVAEKAECLQDVGELLPQIERAARECLDNNDSSCTVSVSLQRECFPTRNYTTFSLPAGTYTALRVTLGEGKGHNWWCVAFPSICMRAASDLNEAAAAGGFTESEVKLITEENEGYKIKFKTMELLQMFKERVFP